MTEFKNIAPRVWKAVTQAFSPALKTALWVIKLTVPITLGIAILRYAGVIDIISEWLTPMFALMGLSGESSLVFITSALGNIYSAIAVMATIGVDYRSALILATMCLICHNMIIETAIQHKAGASTAFVVALRISVALLSGILLNLVVPTDISGRLFFSSGLESVTSWQEMFVNWAITLAPLILKMLVLIISLNIIQTIFREFRILSLISVPLRPLMKLFGLPLSTSFLWIICNVVGLTYGGAAIIDEVKQGDVSHDDARLLNTHVAISHSLLEDTIILVSIGLPVLWLIIPRIILAICAVWLQRLYRKLCPKNVLSAI